MPDRTHIQQLEDLAARLRDAVAIAALLAFGLWLFTADPIAKVAATVLEAQHVER